MQKPEDRRKVGIASKIFRDTVGPGPNNKVLKGDSPTAGMRKAENPLTGELQFLKTKATRKVTPEESAALYKEYYSSNFSMAELALKYDLTRNQVAGACSNHYVDRKSVMAISGRGGQNGVDENSWDHVLFEPWAKRKERRAQEKRATLAAAQKTQKEIKA